MKKFSLTNIQFLMATNIALLIAVGFLYSNLNYNSQRTNVVIDEEKNLTLAIHHSDNRKTNQTERLINETNAKADRNYLATVKGIGELIHTQDVKNSNLTNYFNGLINNIIENQNDIKRLLSIDINNTNTTRK